METGRGREPRSPLNRLPRRPVSHPPSRRFKGVVLDMDGTLVSSELDFDVIRAEAGVPEGVAVLEFIGGLSPHGPSGNERERALRVLLSHERRAARRCSLQAGARQILRSLRERGVKLALFTRNSRDSVQIVLGRFGLEFDFWVAREDAAPKPSPEPVLKIAEALGLSPHELLVVGDYAFDIQAGRAAGAATALLKTNALTFPDPNPDVVVTQLTDLLPWFPEEAE